MEPAHYTERLRRLCVSRRSLSFRKNSCQPNADPLVHIIIERMNELRVSTPVFCELVGLSPKTFDQWKIGRSPRTSDIHAAFAALGLILSVAKSPDKRWTELVQQVSREKLDQLLAAPEPSAIPQHARHP